MVKLWRCEICGDPYVGKSAPANCPFCGAPKAYIKEAKDAKVTFDVTLNEADKANVEQSLKLEVGNSAFYFCASAKTDDAIGQQMFKALAKVEREHANIWRKLLKLDALPESTEECSTVNADNVEESIKREKKAARFYKKALKVCQNERMKQLLEAIIKVEKDHLKLDKQMSAGGKGAKDDSA